MIFWTFQKSSASPSKALALPTPAPSSSVEATLFKPVDDVTMLKDTSSVPDSSSHPMNEPPSSQGVDPPIIEAEDTPMSPPVVATSSRSDKGKSSRMGESLVASLAEGAPSSTIVDEVVFLLAPFLFPTYLRETQVLELDCCELHFWWFLVKRGQSTFVSLNGRRDNVFRDVDNIHILVNLYDPMSISRTKRAENMSEQENVGNHIL
ncbi:uncharacterized protein LOC111369150 [Olea europaea var. sylvestris]|uniref:uncharacterized protein LOC111369150 n=1 Tax=Olea europaea var. sylvestris TaxID=158386 RepID=UPI000C1CDE11|nr:uncharacterized protein LOC111369150 [Olea europaea var. sylvestris]